MSNALISFILMILILVIIIVYVIVIFETAKNKTFIFAPYEPEPTFPAIRPFGQTIPLSAQDIEDRQAIIQEALNQ